MSVRLCYLEREDRGGRLRRVRLVGSRADDSLDAPPGLTDGAPSEAMASAAALGAAWIGQKLDERVGPRRVELVCLDGDGAVCAWVASPGGDRRSTIALVGQQAEGLGSGFDEFGGDAGPSRLPDLPGEVRFEPLVGGAFARRGKSRANGAAATIEPDDGPGRTAVLAAPDVPGRAFVDALDDAGIDVGAAVSIWHAMASVWDPGSARASASGASGDGAAVVAAVAPASAVVLVEPEGRVLWCWSAGGMLLATGSARLPKGPPPAGVNGNGPAGPGGAAGATGPGGSPAALSAELAQSVAGDMRGATLTERALARLSGEWLAWSAQIGRVPERVTLVSRDMAGAPLDGPAAARLLRRALPEVTVDAVSDEDPVGLTLRRLAESLEDGKVTPPAIDDGRRSLVALSNRPGRKHRAMYFWTAAALAAVALVLGAAAFRVWSVVPAIEAQSAQARAAADDAVAAIDPELVDDDFRRRRVLELLAVLNNETRAASSIGEPPPIWDAMFDLSLILGSEDYELRTLAFTPRIGVQVEVAIDADTPTEEIAVAERLSETMIEQLRDRIVWSRPAFNEVRGSLVVTMFGQWRDRPQDTTGGGS